MVVMADTVLATAMDTDMARGPLMPSPLLPLRPSLRLRLMPMPTTAMADTATAMAVTALATAMDTDMERGQLMLMPMPTMAMVDTALAMEATAMAAMVDTDTESKKSKSISCNNTKNPTPNYLKLTYLNGQENYGCVSFKQRQRV